VPITVISTDSRSRLERARAWLGARPGAEEVVIVAANIEAASQLARDLVRSTGSAFGWHRLTLAQLAAAMALPALAGRGLASISQLGSEATVARLVQRLKSEGGLGRFAAVADAPGLPRAFAGVIAELRLARLSPDDVASVAPDVAPLLATGGAARRLGSRGQDGEACRRVASEAGHPPSLAERPLCRHSPEVGAVCGKAARTVLCGGRRMKPVSLPLPAHHPVEPIIKRRGRSASYPEWQGAAMSASGCFPIAQPTMAGASGAAAVRR